MGKQIQELGFAAEKWKLRVAIIALLPNKSYFLNVEKNPAIISVKTKI
jgi:hypothetical protein